MHKGAYASMCIRGGGELSRKAARCSKWRGLKPLPVQIAASQNRRRPMSLPGLDRWYRFIKSHDRAELKAMLHPDVVFESPVVHTPQRGADITYKYLASAIKVLNGDSFRYLGEWRGDNSAVLEFATEIDGITINGVDIIKFADDGRIIHFKVMVRPLKAMNLLHRLMGEQLAVQ